MLHYLILPLVLSGNGFSVISVDLSVAVITNLSILCEGDSEAAHLLVSSSESLFDAESKQQKLN